MRKFLTLLMLLVAVGVDAKVIKGKIKDASTGEEIIGAYVAVKEAPQDGGISGLDGRYSFEVHRSGCTIVCSYIGYKKFEKKIADNEDYVEIDLVSEANQLAEVVVVGQNSGRTEAAARGIEKESMNVVNVLSSKAMELSPDQTVGNVIRRMSGVTIERNNTGEGQYAILRGMDKRYNYTLVNGVKIPSPDNKNRFVPLDIFPSELLDRLEVHKSLTANLEGDGIGGAVNLEMKDAPRERQLTFNVATGYSALFFDNDFQSFRTSDINRKSPNEIKGMDAPVSMSDFTTSNLHMTNKTALPDMVAGFSYGDRFLDDHLGVMVAASFNNSSRGKDSELHYQPGSTYTGVTHRFYSEQQMRLGTHLKLDYYLSRDHKFTLYGGYMDMHNAQVRDAANPEWEKIRMRWNRQYIFNSTMKGEHGFLYNHALKLKWSAVASKAYNETPDNAEINLTTASNGMQTVSRSGTTRRWEHNSDRDFAGYVDLSYLWKLTSASSFNFAVGGMFRDKQRTSFFNEYFFSPSASNLSQMRGRDWNNFDEIQWDVRRYGSLSDPLNYDASEQIGAGYGSVKFISGKMEAVAGLRVEHTDQGYYLHYATDGARNEGSQIYYDVLPDVHFKYDVHKNAKLHASYYRGINRPSFFEIVPYKIINEDYSERGNPDLKHTVADNFDLRYEYFPGSSEQFMVGLFYKSIKNPIEYGFDSSGQDLYFTPNNYGTARNLGVEIDVMKYFRWFGVKANYTFTNSRITTQKTAMVEQTDANGDVTTVTREVQQTRPLAGQAAHMANLSLLLRDSKYGWDAQIAGGYTGKRLSEVSKYYNDDIWEAGYFQLDLSVEKTFNKRYCLFLKANNLLNSELVRYIPFNSQNENFPEKLKRCKNGILERTERTGQTIVIGFRFKL